MSATSMTTKKKNHVQEDNVGEIIQIKKGRVRGKGHAKFDRLSHADGRRDKLTVKWSSGATTTKRRKYLQRSGYNKDCEFWITNGEDYVKQCETTNFIDELMTNPGEETAKAYNISLHQHTSWSALLSAATSKSKKSFFPVKKMKKKSRQDPENKQDSSTSNDILEKPDETAHYGSKFCRVAAIVAVCLFVPVWMMYGSNPFGNNLVAATDDEDFTEGVMEEHDVNDVSSPITLGKGNHKVMDKCLEHLNDGTITENYHLSTVRDLTYTPGAHIFYKDIVEWAGNHKGTDQANECLEEQRQEYCNKFEWRGDTPFCQD